MWRRVLWTCLILATVMAVVAAIGLRVRAARLADPAVALRSHLGWVPDEVLAGATLEGLSERAGQRTTVIGLRCRPEEARRLAERNKMAVVEARPGVTDGTTTARWLLSDPVHPDQQVHLALPLSGPAVLTIVEPVTW